MWCLSFLLGLAFTGVVMADVESDLQRCVDDVDVENMDKLVAGHEGVDLEIVCPKVLGFMNCIDQTIKDHTGFTLTELAQLLQDEDIRKAATVFENTRSTFGDLCREGSDLNQAYMRNRDCMENANVDTDVCEERARDALDAYLAFENEIEDEAGAHISHPNSKCLLEAYKVACWSAQIHDQCGEEAFQFFHNLIKRTSIFRHALCSEEGLRELKTDFVESLDEEEERKSLFRQAFDLRRRRK